MNQKHEQVLTAGKQARITVGSAKAERLLGPAAQTDSKHQAQAPLA